ALVVSVDPVAVKLTVPAELASAPLSVRVVAARNVMLPVAFTTPAEVEEIELVCEVTPTAPAVAVRAEASVRAWPAVRVTAVPLMLDEAAMAMLVPAVKATGPADEPTAPVSEISAAVAM